MKKLGIRLTSRPVQLHLERALEIFDGPLLNLYRSDEENEPYFGVWVDRDESTERWLLVRVSERDAATYLSQRTSLLDIFKRVRGGIFYVVDLNGTAENISVAVLEDLPAEILPTADSFHDPELEPDGPQEQAILLEQGWEPTRIAELERKYVQVYTFLRALTVDALKLRDRFKHYVFEGGYVHKVAFDQLEAVIPRDERATFASVQVASPGLMRFHVDRAAASDARAAIERFTKHFAPIKAAYTLLHDGVLEHRDLIDEVGRENAKVTASEKALNPIFERMVTLLGGKLTAPVLREACGGTYPAAEVVCTYYRRLDVLRRYQVEKEADFL